MITKEQALAADVLHWRDVHRGRCVSWRRNGKNKVWKRDPFRFYIPLKYGLYDYYHFSQHDTGDDRWHLQQDCPYTTLYNDVLAEQ